MVDLGVMGKAARAAARVLAGLSGDSRAGVLLRLAELLVERRDEILSANAIDVESATAGGLSGALVDRLRLDAARLDAIARDVRTVAALPDPLGHMLERRTLANGLRVEKVRVPIGVIGVVYEARPNVTIDVAAIALKTGNAAILRGGSETLGTNRTLVAVIAEALSELGIPPAAIQFIDDPDRALVLALLRQHREVDLIIPRGGASLHEFCREQATIPVITGGIGICHLFVDRGADLERALPVIRNAKVQRPTVCNALDTLLVDAEIAPAFLPRVVEDLAAHGVSFRADPRAYALVGDAEREVHPAAAEDFDTEWLSLVLGLKVVDGLDEAMAHIAEHGSGHSDGILTEDLSRAERFLREVDTAVVYHNASTRFTDGAELGLGAEVAVSTQKLHARGPMGPTELTTYKWVVRGAYTVRG